MGLSLPNHRNEQNDCMMVSSHKLIYAVLDSLPLFFVVSFAFPLPLALGRWAMDTAFSGGKARFIVQPVVNWSRCVLRSAIPADLPLHEGG